MDQLEKELAGTSEIREGAEKAIFSRPQRPKEPSVNEIEWTPIIKIEKNVYDKPEPSDRKRILVMKLWPRGISKDKVDLWMKDLGTDRELIRKWKERKISWDKFAAEYRKSLKGKEALLMNLAEESKAGTITLLCTDKDPNRCHRSLLKVAIEQRLE